MFSVSFHVKKEFFQKICPRLLFGFKLRHCSCILRYRVLKEIICNYCFIVLHILLNIVITWKSQNLESNKVIIIIIIIIIIIVVLIFLVNRLNQLLVLKTKKKNGSQVIRAVFT